MRSPCAVAVAGIAPAALLVFTLHATAQDHALFVDVAAENLFRFGRAAIGSGGNAVMRLRGLVLKGRSRFVADDAGGLAGAALEIKLLLPDHYLRTDTSGVLEKRAGYAGGIVLSSMRNGDQITYPPDRLLKPILVNERQRVARLLLGAVMYAGSDLALTFRSVPKSMELIDPRVNARTSAKVETSSVEPFAALVTGHDFEARLVVDGRTRAPLRIEYAGGDKNPVTVAFDDRRVVDGLLVPFHVVTTSNGRILDELMLDEILVNPELSKRDFKRTP
jgi:hypothetical protein